MEKFDKHDSSDETSLSSTTDRRSKAPSYECKICGAPALHSNYGAITCYPCKMFFKRHVTRAPKQLTCDFNNQCEINMSNRHVCSACRLVKCFANGMQSELIRCPLSKKQTSKIIERTNILRTTNQLKPLSISNLLRSNNSILTTNQWALLSNLIYGYDEGILLSIAQQLMTKYDSTLAEEFFMKINEISEIYIRSNNDFRTLSSDDRSAFLRSIAENVRCLSLVISWNQSQLYNSQSFINIHIDLYGQNSVAMIRRILKFLDPDIIIAKLILSLFAFTNNTSIFLSPMIVKPFNTLAISRIQNIYTEVIWKYFIDKYGYYQSIQRFNNLIQCLLAATTTISDAQSIEKHVDEITLLVEQTELSLVLDDIDRIDGDKIDGDNN